MKRNSNISLDLWLALFLLLLGGVLRFYDLTDPPLDYHPSRQLRGAIIARSIYYQILPNADPIRREMALSIARSTGRFEAPLLETLTAYTYRFLGSEQLWVGRAYSILFWLIGSFFLYLLARRVTNPAAALFSLGFMLFFALCGAGQPRVPTRSGDDDVDCDWRLCVLTLARNPILALGDLRCCRQWDGSADQAGCWLSGWLLRNCHSAKPLLYPAGYPKHPSMGDGFACGSDTLCLLPFEPSGEYRCLF